MQFLSDDYATSDQITSDDIAELKKQGFTAIFCHRPDHEEEGQPNFETIAEHAKSEGLEMHHLPVVPGKITEADHADFSALYAAAPKPILAFCKTGGRAKMLWDSLQD